MEQPPAAIGSSSDGVTSGGKSGFMSLNCGPSSFQLPSARGDRFLTRWRRGRRQKSPGLMA
jgi:hypothetical protein